MRRPHYRTCILAPLLIGTALSTFAAQDPVDFNRDIRPILADKCFHCHGPDAKNQKSDFRLDTEAHAYAKLGARFGIKPGSLAESEVHARIRTTDPDDQMPPPSSKRAISTAEKDTLDAWITQGAKWDQHWAFKQPVRPRLPETKASWGRNPIDAFVLHKLEAEGLRPSPRAERETLFRRAALVTTGLPPTPAQMDRFLADPSDQGYQQAIARLMGSIDYAERQALRWLDAARYADTDGYQNDAGRSNWPWRDWVIKAFRENMPFDQFTIEQIAGDMLPDATSSQVLASAFNRNHRQNSEGGALSEEFFVENVIDRVETTSTVWLGLTMGCTRCHDHKYDPISQREFYQFFAYFNNIGESGTGKGVSANPILKTRSPLSQPSADLAKRIKAAGLVTAEAENTLEQRLEHWAKTFSIKAEAEKNAWMPGEVLEAKSSVGKLKKEPDSSWRLTGAHKKRATYTVTVAPGAGRLTGLRLDALPHDAFTKPRQLARSSNGNFVLSEVEIRVGQRAIPIRQVSATFAQKDYPATNLIDGNPATGWAVYAGTGPAPVSAFFLFASPVEAKAKTTLTVTLRHSSKFADHNLGRFMLLLTSSDAPDLKGSGGLQPAVLAVLKKTAGGRSDADHQLLRDYFRTIDGPLLAAKAEQAKLEKEMGKQGFKEVPVMVMRERQGNRMPAYLLNRGQYTEPDKSEELARKLPAALFPGPAESQPKDRLELARWLVSPENPLTARVIVNRTWQGLFGTGLVKTVEDFGAQGEVPPNPGLLDWLAVEFMESGWDYQALLSLILASETFQQSARVTADLLERDPQNRLLARGPRYRLDGFVIRDAALQAAGILTRKAGGPPVKPYQPSGLWNAVSGGSNIRYTPGKGADLYRKSMYTYWKRAVNPPRQIIFDAGGRETCNVHERVTNTPLQALVLMNDVTFVEAARHLAERVLKEKHPRARDRLARIYRYANARSIDARTLDILSDNLVFFQPHFKAHPEAAAAFLAAGESPRDESLDPVEHAAYAAVAHLVLNLDETMTLE
jgi:hypothetical protein